MGVSRWNRGEAGHLVTVRVRAAKREQYHSMACVQRVSWTVSTHRGPLPSGSVFEIRGIRSFL